MATGSRYRTQVRSPRRTTEWSIGPVDTGSPITGSGDFIWDTGSIITQSATVVRIRGLFSIYLKTADAVNSGFVGAVGIGIASTDAFTAGALPDPSGDATWPWIWHSFFDIRAITATLADGVNAGGVFTRMLIDSKAMRKQNPDETLFGSIQVLSESGNATAHFFARTRVLDKLA